MTTTVKVEAHCRTGLEVVVEVQDGQSANADVLQDGQTCEVYAYDARKITVYEREKAAAG